MQFRVLAVLIVSGLVWHQIFFTLQEIQAQKKIAEHRTEINRGDVYRFEVAMVYDKNERQHSTSIPFALASDARKGAVAFVAALKTSVPIENSERTKIDFVTPLYYGNVKSDTGDDASGFPPCAAANLSSEFRKSESLIVVGKNWRCRMHALPVELELISGDEFFPMLALPESSMGEISGQNSVNDIKAMWLAFRNPDEANAVLKIAAEKYSIQLEMRAVGLTLRSQLEVIAATTKYWLTAALMLLLFSTGIYIHGVYDSLSQEFGLRASVGVPTCNLIVWLGTDLFGQATLVAVLSGLLVAGMHSILNETDGMGDYLQVLGSAILALPILAFLGGACLVYIGTRDGQLVKFLK